MVKSERSKQDLKKSSENQKDTQTQGATTTGYNKDQRNCFVKHISRNKLIYEVLCSLITAIATVVLAITTFQSLSTVAEQQTLSYRQFVLANQPSVRIYPRKSNPVEFKDDMVIFHWYITNKGGYVENLSFKTIIAAFDKISENNASRLKLRQNELVIKIYVKDKLDRDEISDHFTATGGKFGNDWVKKAIDNESIFTCIAFRVQYDVPKELTIDGLGRKEHRFIFLYWHPIFKNLADAEGAELMAINKALIEAKIIESDDIKSRAD
ncbi:hypothetical protein [uncultured Desulfosarcina sp.]|uniref:hypothetical protein n=1 Tax=uncultured Desulfosarcina sp. TaxID=218289 RepID=UPI0029C62A9A|nr:hypothetical protein [uncultured Desulfosarcina sp.]